MPFGLVKANHRIIDGFCGITSISILSLNTRWYEGRPGNSPLFPPVSAKQRRTGTDGSTVRTKMRKKIARRARQTFPSLEDLSPSVVCEAPRACLNGVRWMNRAMPAQLLELGSGVIVS